MQLHTLSAVDLLDRALDVYRKRFRQLIVIATALLGPLALVDIALWLLLPSSDATDNLRTVIDLVGQALAAGTMTWAVSCAYLDQPVSFQDALWASARRYGSLLGMTLLTGLVLAAPLAVLLWPAGYLILYSDCLALPALIAFVTYAIVLVTRWSLSTVAITIESLGAVNGLRRSWELTGGSTWRVLWVVMLTAILPLVIFAVPAAAMLLTTNTPSLFTAASIALILAKPMIQIVLLPFSTTVITLVYYDLVPIDLQDSTETPVSSITASRNECPTCGELNPPNSRHCIACGGRL